MKIGFEKFSTWMSRVYLCMLIAGDIICYKQPDKVGMVLCSFSLGMWMSGWVEEKLNELEGEQ